MYKYYVLYRPISIGTVPNGFIDFINYDTRQRIRDTSYKAFGEVYYEKRLSPDQIKNYELKEELSPVEKKKVLEDIKKLDVISEKIENLKLNDENLKNTMKKVSKLVNQEILKHMNNNLISHKEYMEAGTLIEEEEEETL